jgi:hypothetical protein
VTERVFDMAAPDAIFFTAAGAPGGGSGGGSDRLSRVRRLDQAENAFTRRRRFS